MTINQYVSHEDSCGGMAGGDYDRYEVDTPEWSAAKKAAAAKAEKAKKILGL